MAIKLDTATSGPDLVNHGGKVLDKMNVAPIYYGSYWGTAAGKADAQYLDGFAKDILHSKYMSVLGQYGAGGGDLLGSDTVAKKAPKTFTEKTIQSIVKAQLKSGAVKQEDGETVYTVYLPPGAVLKAPDGSTSKQGLGGYHGSFDYNGKKVYYAAICYSQGSNGIDFDGKARDNVSITASHELSEAATDPDVNNGTLGWYDDQYGEIGDIPINMGTPLAQVYGRVDGYAVQKEWSNKDGVAETAAKNAKSALDAFEPA